MGDPGRRDGRRSEVAGAGRSRLGRRERGAARRGGHEKSRARPNEGSVRARARRRRHAPGRPLEALAAALEAHGRAAFAFGGVARALPDGSLERRPYRWFAPGLVEAGAVERVWREERVVPIAGGAVMWRRHVLFAYGGWAALSGSEDSAPLLAAGLHRDGVYVGRDVLLQRVHARQLTATSDYASARGVNWAFVDERLRALRALDA